MMVDRAITPFSEGAGKPDKLKVRQAFSDSAARYDQLADLQRLVADRLLARLACSVVGCRCLLDVGTGTGYCAARLSRMFPDARWIALDLAEGMLRQLHLATDPRSKFWLVAGDAEALPIADRAVDLLVSSLALQWCPEPAAAIREFARVLKPEGYLFFTTFGPGTLSQLRDAWSQVDGYTHVNVFTPPEELARVIAECRLESLFLETESRVVRYADVATLMRELKGLGAHNVTGERPRGLMGKGVLSRMISAYCERHATADGGIEASFEVIHGAAKRVIQ